MWYNIGSKGENGGNENTKVTVVTFLHGEDAFQFAPTPAANYYSTIDIYITMWYNIGSKGENFCPANQKVTVVTFSNNPTTRGSET